MEYGSELIACERCQLFEAIRYDRIKRYVALLDLRRLKPERAEEVKRQIAAVEIEINEAWKNLDRHRRGHAEHP